MSSKDGVHYILAINTKNEDVEIKVTPQELIPFDFCKFLGEQTSESEGNELIRDSNSTYEERVERVINILQFFSPNFGRAGTYTPLGKRVFGCFTPKRRGAH